MIYEDHPTHPNRFGRIEHHARMGALFTDFKLIKPGAVHLANGGYLVLDAAKVVSQPMIWEELKRIMRSRRLRIEGIYESLGLSSTVTLEPEEIPIDVKIVLIGDRRLHYLMSAYDPDVMDLFKVPVDFEDSMQRTQRSERQYASLIAGIARGLELRPLNAMAVARVIEQGSRLSGDAARLTLQFRLVQDLCARPIITRRRLGRARLARRMWRKPFVCIFVAVTGSASAVMSRSIAAPLW